MGNQNQGFWSSLQGILTGIAAVITAITGLYIAIAGNSVEKDDESVAQTTQQQEQQKPPKETAQPSTTVSTSVFSAAQPKVITPKTIGPEITLPKTALSLSTDLVECEYFPSVNSVRSLMSWSNHYQQQIVEAQGVTARALSSCKKTISYRAQAYCQSPKDTEIRQALFDTLSLCEAAGIDWTSATKDN